MINAQDIVKFVLKHRAGKVFQDCTEEDIGRMVQHGVEEQTLYYATDDSGVVGIVYGVPFHNQKMIFVWNLLTTEGWVMPMFLKKFGAMYNGYTLEADRRGRRVRYNTPKLLKRFTT